MRLDHVSYVASHDQISDVVQRIGSQIGTAFVDGGIHPRFGTRNFTAPLLNGQYIEVVCPLDHPAAEQTPFGKAVSRKAAEGGGWLTWVIATGNLEPIESKIGRKAVNGHRRRPDGTDLNWQQIGIIEVLADRVNPFFIKWTSEEHPSNDGKAVSRITAINFKDTDSASKRAVEEYVKLLDKEEIIVSWKKESENSDWEGINSIEFTTPNGSLLID